MRRACDRSLHPTDLAHVRARPVSRAPILRLATAVLFLKTLFIDAAIRGADEKTLRPKLFRCENAGPCCLPFYGRRRSRGLDDRRQELSTLSAVQQPNRSGTKVLRRNPRGDHFGQPRRDAVLVLVYRGARSLVPTARANMQAQGCGKRAAVGSAPACCRPSARARGSTAR